MMKTLRKIGLLIIAILLGMAIGLITFVLMFRDEVKQFAVQELNKKILTGIDVEEIEFSVFKRFPEASLELKNVVVHAPVPFKESNNLGRGDTVCIASRAYFEFNMADILKKNFKIAQIGLENGMLYLATTKNGQKNYQVFQKNEQDSASAFFLELKKVGLKNMHIVYLDQQKNLLADATCKNSSLNGQFSASDYTLKSKGTLAVYQLMVQDISYLQDQPVEYQVVFDVKEKDFSIRSSNVQIGAMEFTCEGEIKGQEPGSLDLSVSGKNLNFQSFISMLPANIRSFEKDIKSTGNFFFNARVNGHTGPGQKPSVYARFGISNGNVLFRKKDLEFSDVNGMCSYTNNSGLSPGAAILKFDDIQFVYNNSKLTSSGILKNFKKPIYFFKTDAKIDLRDINSLAGDSMKVKFDVGLVEAKLSIEGKIKDFNNIRVEDFAHAAYKGFIKVIKDATIAYKPANLVFSNIHGTLDVDKYLVMKNMKTNLGNSDFTIDAQLANALPFILLDNQNIWIDARLKSQSFAWSDLSGKKPGNEKNNQTDTLLFPGNLHVQLKYQVDQFKFGELALANMEGSLSYANKTLGLNSFLLTTNEGLINGKASLKQNKDHSFLVTTESTVTDMDIAKIFKTFHNFGQNVLKPEHLNGTVSANVNLYSEWTNDFKLVKDKLLVQCDVVIKNGKLVGFEPLYGLSKYVSLEELEDLHFSTLENSIFIKDQKVTIPGMDIHSSALSISGSGEHYFDNRYSYHVKVALSDILFKKAKRKQKKIDEYAIREDNIGKTSVFLSIEGKDSEYEVKFDKKSMREKVKQDIKEEKNELKEILNEEYNMFKNDTTLNQPVTGTRNPGWSKTDQADTGSTYQNTNVPHPFVWDDEE